MSERHDNAILNSEFCILNSPRNLPQPLLGKEGGHRRRGTVLVLVMTMLSVLFVLGVAFLATMNFEAEMISAEQSRARMRHGIDAVVSDTTAALQQRLVSATAASAGASSGTAAFVDLPIDRSLYAPIEPYWEINNASDPSDDQLVYAWFTDLPAVSSATNGQTPLWMQQLNAIDTSVRNGETAKTLKTALTPTGSAGWCNGGPTPTSLCDPNDPNACLPNGSCIPIPAADADGDGVVDSVYFDASSDLGLSRYQVDTLSNAVNGGAYNAGNVSVAVRVVPHGGMVDLNESHPRLIQNVLNLPYWPLPKNWPPDNNDCQPDPNMNYFLHRPTMCGRFYSPTAEEESLRRRMFLPSQELSATELQGNPWLTDPDRARGDLGQFLFPPATTAVGFQTVDNHRFWMVAPDEFLETDPNVLVRAARLEPFTTNQSAEYDRRHLLTTASHDDLLSRGGTVQTPAGPMDLRDAMLAANRSTYDPGGDPKCQRLLPFEIANYPQDLPNDTTPNEAGDVCDCPTNPVCRFDPRKGRLKLSLPWLDNVFSNDGDNTNDLITQAQWERIIYDAFYMLVRNAARTVPAPAVDPTTNNIISCTNDGDCASVCAPPVVCPAGSVSVCTTTGPMAGTCTIPCPQTPLPETAATAVCTGDTTLPGIYELGAPYWQDQRCTTAASAACRPGETCIPDTLTAAVGFCGDPVTRQRRSLALVSRTAASLTANMIDFVDQDFVPTRIALRSFDFDDEDYGDCYGGGAMGEPCKQDSDCTSGTCRLPKRTVGRAFGEVDQYGNYIGMRRPPQYVYGIERQPFITAITTVAVPVGSPPTPVQSEWAIELFNPFGLNVTPLGDFWLYIVTPTAPNALATARQIHVTQPLLPFNPTGTGGPFTELLAPGPPPGGAILPAMAATATSTVYPGAVTGPLRPINKGDIIYLVQRLSYDGGATTTNIVVDQFPLTTPCVGVQGAPLVALDAAGTCPKDPGATDAYVYTARRSIPNPATPPNTFWTGTVPTVGPEAIGTPVPLGAWNAALAGVLPVEIRFADTWSFTRPRPDEPDPDNPVNFGIGFPTTGSLLVTLRHANRSTADFAPPPNPVTNLAFTTWLNNAYTLTYPRTGAAAAIVPESGEIDNGRMPVFDKGVPGIGPWKNNQFSMHHMQPWLTFQNQQGSDLTLPWGQLVFDYFTALPLAGGGPYRKPPGAPAAWLPGRPQSQPRVDNNGLRVHGRIDINAAPWTVLSGLPRMPVNQFPAAIRAQLAASSIKSCNGGSNDGQVCINAAQCPGGGTCDPTPTIGRFLAQSIVAYREQRSINDPVSGGTTGTFVDGTPAAVPQTSARGWNFPNPALRRGTGFLSVGELANVRHDGATTALLPDYRIDFNVGTPTGPPPDFLQAAAGLIMLGDWVTTRSDVATVYGVIRGVADQDFDQELQAEGVNSAAQRQTLLQQDIDSRAIRFQETIDRLPAMTGEGMPARIGQRVVTPYTDVSNN